MIEGYTPKEIVAKLDEFIVGQADAKKAVAIALRNRARRMALGHDPIQEEIHPKNIVMIGPTGVGKTEIARRLSKLADAPFVKVEATKFTEVGYVGRDVESMVRDLVNNSLKMTRISYEEKVREEAIKNTEERIIDILMAGQDSKVEDATLKDDEDEKEIRDLMRKKLKTGKFEDKEIEIKTAGQSNQPMMQVMAMPGMDDIENQMQNLLGDMFPKKKSQKKLSIKDARKFLLEEEIESLIDQEKLKADAIERAENSGIIFIDEIDKITGRESKGGPDVSREGVQRDILPLVEGSTVNTKHGQIKTDHILFIAAGAFHISSVTDLIPELQGRFPIRVELQALKQEDYISILQNPKNALSKQYQALMSTEGIALRFEKSGFKELAKIAHEMNLKHENIGARRLHTIMERLLEELSYNAEQYKGKEITVDREYVQSQLSEIVKDQDLSKYIL